MKGSIGTKQRCGVCASKFSGKDNNGFFCEEHPFVRPTRYYIQATYFGIDKYLYSTPTGQVLSSYELTKGLLGQIRTEWDESLRGGKAFNPNSYIHKKVKSKNIKEIALRYIASKKRKWDKEKMSQSHWQQINNINNKFIIKYFGSKNIESITDKHIEEFYNFLEDATYINKRKEVEKYSTKHIKDIMMMLRCLYNFEKKDAPDFPDGWNEIEPKRNKRQLKVDEQMAIDPHIPDRHGYRLAIHILQTTGMRICELRALWIGDITDTGVMVWKSYTDRLKKIRKGYATEQHYVLPTYLMDELKDHVQDKRASEDFIFSIKGRPYCMSTLRNVWNKAVKKSGVEKIELNQGGRHTWASREMMEAKEAAMNRIQKQLSHTNRSTQKHYVIEK